ncbi:MAG TPA: urease accessory protein [Thermoanaerobaculia bacterium]|nr:urease accessory protein [Thermoanaerobaculia bacterium]
MISILVLGFLVGMRHALEADHLAAVATLVADRGGARKMALRGAVWGVGHTLTLFLVAGVCLVLGGVVPERLSWVAELAVGVMLILLGADVLLRMRRGGVHLHAHEHADGTVHLHAHAHHHDAPHDDEAAHRHRHERGFLRRALAVGMVHGLAGSAALLLLALPVGGSPWLVLGYVACFGLGSVLGMALLSAVIAVPLQASARLLEGAYRTLMMAVGFASAAVGAWILYGLSAGAH